MATKLLLAAGACFLQGGTFDKCALQPINCSTGSTFRSSHWLALNDATVSGQCSDQETIRTLKSLGRCNGQADRYICTSHQTACRFAAVFEPNTDDCNLVHDFYDANEFTNAHFGYCWDRFQEHKNFCTWSFQECGGSSTDFEWKGADTFGADSKPPCLCDDVRLGACVDGNNANEYCAVSGEVCDTDSGFTYLKVLDLESKLSTECRLCSSLSEDDLKLPDNGQSTLDDTKKKSTGQIVGITIGIVLGTMGIILVGMVIGMRMKSASKEAEEAENAEGPRDAKSLNSVL